MKYQSDLHSLKRSFLPTLSLLTSFSTLVCCALPALFVTLGAGATLAGLISIAPWLVTLSEYKAWTFGISGGLLLIAGYWQWQSRSAPCPVDTEQANICRRLRCFNTWVFAASLVVWVVGFFFAYLAIYVL